MNRRSFLYNSGLASLAFSSGKWNYKRLVEPDLQKITILHTNDVHSRIEPFPNDGSRNAGLGGVSKRATLIEQIRAEEEFVLLLDAGDIFQGTPYFNFFGGEIEMKAMSALKYDAATIGNHDFDNGIDGLNASLIHSNFPLVTSNYDFSDTIMHDSYKPYLIKKVGEIKIGIFGLGIELNGLVPKSLYKNTKYLDPLAVSDKIAAELKHDHACDYVVCLSHLGYKYRDNTVSDVVLAEHSRDINLIIGGHTHTFLKKADIRKNSKGKEVVVNQAGWAGIMLGRVDIFFEKNKKGRCVTCQNTYLN
jgi:5'-nucleotidase